MTFNNSAMTEIEQPLSFIKPLDICKDLTGWETSLLSLNENDFAKAYMNHLDDELMSYGLKLRLAEIEDINTVYSFIIKRFNPSYIDDVSKYDIFRFIEYGHGLILENENSEIMGCLFEVGYEKEYKISYSIRLGVDETISGKSLGQKLTVYSCLLAMARGAQIKKGLIDYDNFRSLHIHVNQVGWLIDSFYPNLEALGPSFSFSLPLTPKAMLLNRVDSKKVKRFIDENINGVDYKLLESNDKKGINLMYENSNFRIAAINRSESSEVPLFLALPIDVLNFKI